MPIYCDRCEAVIDRPEELTRVDGEDFCLDCTAKLKPWREPVPMSIPASDLGALVELVRAATALLNTEEGDDKLKDWVALREAVDTVHSAFAVVGLQVRLEALARRGEA